MALSFFGQCELFERAGEIVYTVAYSCKIVAEDNEIGQHWASRQFFKCKFVKCNLSFSSFPSPQIFRPLLAFAILFDAPQDLKASTLCLLFCVWKLPKNKNRF